MRLKLRKMMKKTQEAIKAVKPLEVLQFFSYQSSKDEELNTLILELRNFVNTLYFNENASFCLSASNILQFYMGFTLYSFKDERAVKFLKDLKNFKFT